MRRSRPYRPLSSEAWSGGVGLDEDFNLHIITQDGIEVFPTVDAKVGGLDRELACQADLLLAIHWIGTRAENFDRDHYRFGDAMHGQIAGDVQHVLLFLNLCRCKYDGWKLGDIEKISALQMAIPALILRVETGNINRSIERTFSGVLGVVGDRTGEGTEGSLRFAHQVPDTESDGRVARIDCVRVGQCRGRSQCSGDRQQTENSQASQNVPPSRFLKDSVTPFGHHDDRT